MKMFILYKFNWGTVGGLPACLYTRINLIILNQEQSQTDKIDFLVTKVSKLSCGGFCWPDRTECKASSQFNNTDQSLPWATTISASRKNKSQDALGIFGEDLGTRPPSLSVCAPNPMMRSQTPLWGKSESGKTRTIVACSFRGDVIKKSPLKPPRGFVKNIDPALFFANLRTVTIYKMTGASPPVREDAALKSAFPWKCSLALPKGADRRVVSMADSCSG